MLNDIFLQLTGGAAILGESRDSDFINAIELLSFDIGGGELQPPAPAAQEPGKIDAEGNYTPPPKADRDNPNRHVAGKGTAAHGFDLNSYSCTLKVVKEVDNSSPDLFVNFCKTLIRKPDFIPTATLTVRKDGDSGSDKSLQYLIYKFTNVYVTQYDFQDAGESLMPTEKLEFRYSTCQMTYKPQKETAAVPVVLGWDFDQNKKM